MKNGIQQSTKLGSMNVYNEIPLQSRLECKYIVNCDANVEENV